MTRWVCTPLFEAGCNMQWTAAGELGAAVAHHHVQLCTAKRCDSERDEVLSAWLWCAACVQVKEAREAAREATALIQQLHRFVAEQGSDGDWRAWASTNLPYSGVQHRHRERQDTPGISATLAPHPLQIGRCLHKMMSSHPNTSMLDSMLCCALLLCRLAVTCTNSSPQPAGRQVFQQLQAAGPAAHVTHRRALQACCSGQRCHRGARQQGTPAAGLSS